MNNIIMFSDQYLPNHPHLEVPLYEELAKRTPVMYVLQKNDIRLTDPKLKAGFKHVNVMAIDKPKHILKYMKKGDLFISRFAYKLTAGEVSDKLRAAKHKILHLDPSGIDIRVRAGSAQYLTAKSEQLRRATMKKFPKHYKQIFTTGTLHYDAAATTSVDRDEFMRSYGLDPKKEFALLTPASPGEAWMPGIQDDYKRMVKIIKTKCPDYELAIKCHPYDYTANMPAQIGVIHKSQHYGGKPCWEVIAPGETVIKADEGYKAIKACDVIVNIRSSLAMETAFFRKPLVNVNRSKYVTNWPYNAKTMMDIQIGELADTLNKCNYRNPDETECVRYVKECCYSDDGKAYMRTADVAMKILEGKA